MRRQPTSLRPAKSSFSGDLRIAQGTVELSLFNAVTLTVQGPAHLDLRSPENIILHQGRLHAHVPEPAKGFTITTSAGRLVDLGTDFGVSRLGGKPRGSRRI